MAQSGVVLSFADLEASHLEFFCVDAKMKGKRGLHFCLHARVTDPFGLVLRRQPRAVRQTSILSMASGSGSAVASAAAHKDHLIRFPFSFVFLRAQALCSKVLSCPQTTAERLQPGRFLFHQRALLTDQNICLRLFRPAPLSSAQPC